MRWHNIFVYKLGIVKVLKRIFEVSLALLVGGILLIPFFSLAILIRTTSPGPVLHWSKRVGRFNIIFEMPKFRTMIIGTPMVASHLISDSAKWLTPIGNFLRKSSLDELPQLWCIINGDMSFVGPRPALFNQVDLISLRNQCGVNKLRPGLTGWAQVNGRDELSIPDKVKLDLEYLDRQSLMFDCYILWLTFIKVLSKDGVSH